MESLSLKDTQNLHQGIQKLYTLHNLDTFGVEALTILNQLVPSYIPHLHVTPVRARQVLHTFLSDFSALHRPQRSFTERDRLILNLLRPHLFQAYCNAQHCQQLRQDLSQLQQSLNHLGLVILDTEGRVQFVTPQAVVLLKNYFSEPTGSLELPDHLCAWIKHQVTCLTKNPDLPKACLPLRIQQAGKQLVIRLIVEQPGDRYLLLLDEQTSSLLNLLKLLGLSLRETEVLFWVMQGKDNKAIAAQLSVGKSTVRKHLESIYCKLGIQSRTEAIAQTLEKLGLLNALPLI